MTRIADSTIFLLLSLFLSGCAFVTVEKLSPISATTEIDGQRFSLPRPYIQVTPKDDGTIEAAIVYLPDPERTYAIRSSSYFATDTLDVVTDNGVIKQINWTADSSGVVSEAIKASSNIASEIIKAEETKKAAEKNRLDEASKAVDDAQMEFDLAESRLALLTRAGQPTLDAEIALKAARIKLDAAKSKLAQVRGLVKSPDEEEAKYEAIETHKELSDAVTGLSRAMAASPTVPNDIQNAEIALRNAALKFTQAQQRLEHPHGAVFGPMLFAIHEELRISVPPNNVVPFLEVVTAQQNTDPPTPNWNPPQPNYPVKWPDAPRK